MSKVTLTKEQARAIEGLKKIQHDQYETLIKEKFRGGWRSQSFKEANNIPFEVFVDALLVGYEVEQPKFNADEWVVMKNNRSIIGKTYMNEVGCLDVDRGQLTGLAFSSGTWEHATKEEIKNEKNRQLFAELGREVGDFKDGDVVTTKYNNTYLVRDGLDSNNHNNCSIRSAKQWLKDDHMTGLYPAESYIKFPQ